MTATIRDAAVAGQFYPGDAAALAAEVERHLAAVPASAAPAAVPKLLVVPHAGYVYSAPVAAHAYALLGDAARARIRRVVLLGPTHRVAVRGIALPSVAAFATPLGRVPLDRAAIDALAALPQVVTSDAVHAEEHALEVQLPFLQRALERFTLVPLAVGSVTPAAVAEVIERLWGGDETLIVISTDLSHYLPYRDAVRTDRATVERVLQLDDAQLDHHDACGATPLAGALQVARRRALRPRLLDLRNSGDTAGDRSRVVGYCAIAFDAPPATAADADDGAAAQAPADPLGAALLTRARNAIADAFGLAPAPQPVHPALRAPGATFVTLRRHGQLRGCIGALQPERPLGDDVAMHALAAAFRDPRFAPLAREEFDPALQIEVSLLEPLRPLPARSEDEAIAALRPGVDGVVLRWRDARSTFLPQVWEQLPSPREFLAALKRKAGLAGDFWDDELELSRYQVRKFADAVPQP